MLLDERLRVEVLRLSNLAPPLRRRMDRLEQAVERRATKATVEELTAEVERLRARLEALEGR